MATTTSTGKMDRLFLHLSDHWDCLAGFGVSEFGIRQLSLNLPFFNMKCMHLFGRNAFNVSKEISAKFLASEHNLQ